MSETATLAAARLAPDPASMVSVGELAQRPSRLPDYAAENRALVALAREMATTPNGILQKLADAALTLCHAHSAGFSLLEEEDQKRAFHWRAISGQWSPHVGGGTPRDFGPCGTVLDRNVALLCQRPERDFPCLGEVSPLLDEGLLIPFYVEGEAVGTIWVISHNESRRFDAEDLRVMTNLATFAAAAYQTLLSINATRKANQKLAESEGRLQLLVAELDHRVKNVLATVAAVAKHTSEARGSRVDCIEALNRRIKSMADAHALLSCSRWQGVGLADLIHYELAPYAIAGNTMVKGPYVSLTTDLTQLLAMVLHELATNAAKYGALSTPEGRVSVRWDLQSNEGEPTRLKIEWHEGGGPPVTTPTQPGYGTSVITELIPYELGGTVDLAFGTEGVCCTIDIALESYKSTKQLSADVIETSECVQGSRTPA